jgi:chromosome segregation ATPase
MTNPAAQDVSPRTATALRDAMTRLLAGRPQRTDGQLTKANLGREAGISHATLHRAKTILAEWDTAVATRQPTQADQQAHAHHEETAELRTRLATKTTEHADLRRQLAAAATIIATLHHENMALRAQLNSQGTVFPLEIHHRESELEPSSP